MHIHIIYSQPYDAITMKLKNKKKKQRNSETSTVFSRSETDINNKLMTRSIGYVATMCVDSSLF